MRRASLRRFGELAIVSAKPRAGTAICAEQTKILTVAACHFERFLEIVPLFSSMLGASSTAYRALNSTISTQHEIGHALSFHKVSSLAIDSYLKHGRALQRRNVLGPEADDGDDDGGEDELTTTERRWVRFVDRLLWRHAAASALRPPDAPPPDRRGSVVAAALPRVATEWQQGDSPSSSAARSTSSANEAAGPPPKPVRSVLAEAGEDDGWPAPRRGSVLKLPAESPTPVRSVRAEAGEDDGRPAPRRGSVGKLPPSSMLTGRRASVVPAASV